jgi:hypothetical protein
MAGAPYNIDVGALKTMTVCQPDYAAMMIEKETVNHDLRVGKRGVRVSVRMEFEIITPSADETTLSELLARATDPNDESMIELTLDGVVWREVFLREDALAWTNIEGKNIGVIFGLDWACKKKIPSKPALGSGAW